MFVYKSITTAISATASAAASKVSHYGGQAKEAITSKAYETGDSVKNTLIHKTITAVNYFTGLSNVLNAYECLKNRRVVIVSGDVPTSATIHWHEPGIVERVSDAMGEVTIGAAKVVGGIMFNVGALSKAGTAVGLVNSSSDLSMRHLSELVFQGVTGFGSTVVQAGVYWTPKVGMPAAKSMMGMIVTNKANTIGLAATVALLYSAKQDLAACSPPPVVSVINGGKGVKMKQSTPGFSSRMKSQASALVKTTLAVGVGGLTISSNFPRI